LNFPELSFNLVGVTKSLELQNPSSFFALPKFLPQILNAIDVNPDEVLLEILDSTTINFDEIVELLDSKSNPQAKPLGKNEKFGVNGIGKKVHKKSYDSSSNF
jgi:hypothetical protein